MSPISNVKSIKFIYVFVKTSWRKYLLICYLYFYSYTPWVRIFIDSDWAQVIETLSFRCWEVKMKSSIQQNPCRYAEIPECFIFISLWRALLFIQDLYVTWHYYDTKIRIYLNVLTIIKLICEKIISMCIDCITSSLRQEIDIQLIYILCIYFLYFVLNKQFYKIF